MTDEDKNRLLKIVVIALCVLLIALNAGVVAYIVHMRKEAPKITTSDKLTDPKEIERIVQVTPAESKVIKEEISHAQSAPPQVSYYVTAPSLDSAAKTVQKQIEDKTPDAPKAILDKSDRTVIAKDADKQKVDVYKINLRKDHKIKVGTTWLDHPYLSVGYQAGRFEGTVHFDAQGVHGGTVMYTVWQW